MVVENEALQYGKEIMEKSASEVIKRKGRDDHSEEGTHSEYGKNVN